MSDVDGHKGRAKAWIDEHADEFEEISRYIWSHPELGLEEYEASRKLTEVLQKYGFTVELGVAGMPTAFVASYGRGKPVIGYNAEYDCLPGLSQEAGSTKKEPIMAGAPGQGCGHSLIGTAAVLGAIALKQVMEAKQIPGTLKVFGSPAEEICVGKPFMARAGYYDDVDCFLDWHPFYYNKAHYDTCSAYFSIKYHFSGTGSHGNRPWHGRSAFDAALLASHGIEMLREHYEPAAADRANTVNYTFPDTGPAIPNVVPDHAVMWCVGRFTTSAMMEDVIARIDHCAEAGALATETSVTKEILAKTHEKIPNKILSRMIYDNFVELGAPQFTEEEQEKARQMQIYDGIEPRGLDAEILEFGTSGTVLCDTSEFSWNAPYATFWMTAAPDGGWHNWKVASCVGSSIGMKTLRQAGKLLAVSGISVLEDPGLLADATAEWNQRMNGRVYQCLIPEEVKPCLGINKETMDKYRRFYKAG
ncbi:MAG: amidohydrolase [Syntrophomonadaceae bacterium]|nr:amidohydrolase [Syntrophomonadaceae bacterium]